MGRNLGAYKLARHVLEKIQSLKIPRRFRENVDLASLMVKSKPYHDNEELLTMCYRCSSTNPLMNNRGNQCINCAQPFVHSWVSFEILPLVEFQLEDGITDVEAMRLIESDSGGASEADKWRDRGGEDNMMTLGDTDSEDPFTTRLYSFQQDGGTFSPVVASRSVLQSLGPGEVIVCKWPPPLRNTYFRNLMPDMAITKCQTCNKVFHSDDYELQLLQKGHCPFCRSPGHLGTQKSEQEVDADEAY